MTNKGVIFSSGHEIWKYAYYHDKLDDWLPYAEDLIQNWSSKNEVYFTSTFEITIASLLLLDDLLPLSARNACAMLLIATIKESAEKKYDIESLKLSPPSPGRKKINIHQKGIILFAIRDCVKAGLSPTDAYRIVADKHFKSPDTIRRMYERAIKKQPKS